jgi:hypothetical protein
MSETVVWTRSIRTVSVPLVPSLTMYGTSYSVRMSPARVARTLVLPNMNVSFSNLYDIGSMSISTQTGSTGGPSLLSSENALPSAASR